MKIWQDNSNYVVLFNDKTKKMRKNFMDSDDGFTESFVDITDSDLGECLGITNNDYNYSLKY